MATPAAAAAASAGVFVVESRRFDLSGRRGVSMFHCSLSLPLPAAVGSVGSVGSMGSVGSVGSDGSASKSKTSRSRSRSTD